MEMRQAVSATTDDLVEPRLLARAREILHRESEAFRARTPKSTRWLADAAAVMPDGVPMAWMRGLYRHEPIVAVSGRGAHFDDLDANTYVDFNVADLSMAAGFAPGPIVAAITEQAARGNHFLLPTTQAADVARLLGERFGLPKWQFTLSASSANADAIRLARVATGRTAIVLFDGKYHGHLDQTMWATSGSGTPGEALDPEGLGIDPATGRTVSVLPYNDPAALLDRLGRGDVAAVLLEPALTNCGLVLPLPGFVETLNTAVRAAGSLLVVDETHTQFAVHGGGTARFGFRPDMVTGGKGIGGGIAIGVIGMTDQLAAVMSAHLAYDPGRLESGDTEGLAVGGTLFGNAMSLTAAHAGLTHIFTAAGAARVDSLARRLQVGVQAHLDRVGLPWTMDRLGGRVQWRLTPEAPVTGAQGYASVVLPLSDARKVYMANRGVWDAIGSAGPSVSFAADADDVDSYVAVAGSFVSDLTS